MCAPVIKVGIKTDGVPKIHKRDGYVELDNMLIGDGFHWQTIIKAKLPGHISHTDSSLTRTTGCPESLSGFDNITLINTLPLETYLECVVGSEMNPKSPSEFLKAHAVISRSWALGKIMQIHHCESEGKKDMEGVLIGWDDTAIHRGFNVCSDDHCQRYQGLQEIPSANLKALRETEGEILTDSRGELIDTRFSKCCGGNTELFSTCWQSLDQNCLESFSDPWCDLSGLNSVSRRLLLSSVLKDYDMQTEGYGYRWESEISKAEIAKNLLQKFGKNIGTIKGLEPLHRGLSGRIDVLRIYGANGTLDIGKELWIRRLLSPSHLYSSAFEIEDRGETVKLTGRGWGHGVGLCQIGAANMALQGYSYSEILSFYYPGSSLRKM